MPQGWPRPSANSPDTVTEPHSYDNPGHCSLVVAHTVALLTEPALLPSPLFRHLLLLYSLLADFLEAFSDALFTSCSLTLYITPHTQTQRNMQLYRDIHSQACGYKKMHIHV